MPRRGLPELLSPEKRKRNAARKEQERQQQEEDRRNARKASISSPIETGLAYEEIVGLKQPRPAPTAPGVAGTQHTHSEAGLGTIPIRSAGTQYDVTASQAQPAGDLAPGHSQQWSVPPVVGEGKGKGPAQWPEISAAEAAAWYRGDAAPVNASLPPHRKDPVAEAEAAEERRQQYLAMRAFEHAQFDAPYEHGEEIAIAMRAVDVAGAAEHGTEEDELYAQSEASDADVSDFSESDRPYSEELPLLAAQAALKEASKPAPVLVAQGLSSWRPAAPRHVRKPSSPPSARENNPEYFSDIIGRPLSAVTDTTERTWSVGPSEPASGPERATAWQTQPASPALSARTVFEEDLEEPLSPVEHLRLPEEHRRLHEQLHPNRYRGGRVNYPPVPTVHDLEEAEMQRKKEQRKRDAEAKKKAKGKGRR